MTKRVIIKNGKKYIVNVTDFSDGAGNDFGVGPGGPEGTLWMVSTDGNWYAVNVSGPQGSTVISINQTSINLKTNDAGVDLLACDDGKSYLCSLTGTTPTVTFTVSQTPYGGTASPKPYLLLQSVNNSSFNTVALHNNAGTIQVAVNQIAISGSRVTGTGY